MFYDKPTKEELLKSIQELEGHIAAFEKVTRINIAPVEGEDPGVVGVAIRFGIPHLSNDDDVCGKVSLAEIVRDNVLKMLRRYLEADQRALKCVLKNEAFEEANRRLHEEYGVPMKRDIKPAWATAAPSPLWSIARGSGPHA
jgi:hypothetical protein